ncbi:hypothetical protein Hypma_006122 [Hypsizygus marmoreus]|uniref:MARVEL domain-containing protein n=1 Tax=Hypsizygus marmoreus TaxID=39966 RepID=A0A369JTH2_HYPMA|nr:hypothetical protein Hypma_006122 [Hypsizygus marmoreus]
MAFGAIGIVVVKRLDAQLTDLQRIAIFFHIFMSLFFAVICFLGFFACIARRASATSLYTSLILGQILFSIASGIFCIYLLFNGTSSQPWDTQKCIAAAADQFTRIFCQRSKLLKGLATAMFAIMWLVEIASIFIGNAYLSQLREEALRLEMLDPPKYDRDGNDC